jgi:hypothetical protein
MPRGGLTLARPRMRMARFCYQLRNWKAHAGPSSSAATSSSKARLPVPSMQLPIACEWKARCLPAWSAPMAQLFRLAAWAAASSLPRASTICGTISPRALARPIFQISSITIPASAPGLKLVGDTALGTAAGPARVAGTQDNSVAKTYTSVATIPYTPRKRSPSTAFSPPPPRARFGTAPCLPPSTWSTAIRSSSPIPSQSPTEDRR